MIQIGRIFADRYRIINEIGRGGMANVYLAEDTILDNRKVAIKVLRSNFENDKIAIARFQREAFAMAELSHPNIVGISDVGEFDNQQYIVMEYIDGMTLKRYINEHAPLTNEEAISITTAILSAMEMAHSHGIIHRDLKPQNVLVSSSGEIKVTDFGIAKALSETSLTQTNTMFGSVHYLSPEQARGANATVQSDIYAIGIILFELLTGQIPFDGDSAVAIALKHFQENIPSISNLNPNVPQALENVVIRATAKDVKDRYVDVTQMMNDLATSTSLDRRGEAKLVFKRDNDATRIMPANLINPYDTKPLIDSKIEKLPERRERDRQEHKSDKKPTETAENAETGAPADGKNSKKVKKSRKGLIALLVILALLVGGGALAWNLMTPQNVNIPEVSGMKLSEAKAEIEKAHLKVGKVIKEESDSVDEGHVVRTDPAQKSQVRKNSAVNIYESTGDANIITLKNYVGRNINTVMSELLSDYGITSDMVTQKQVQSDAYEVGTIIKQEPGSGEKFDIAGNKKLVLEVVATKQIEIPDYKPGGSWMTYQDYEAALKNAGFNLDNVTFTARPTTNQQADGYVWSVTPGVGTMADPDATISVLYSQYTAPASTTPSTTSDSSTDDSSSDKSSDDSSSSDSSDKVSSASKSDDTKTSSSSSATKTSASSTTSQSSSDKK